MAARSRAFERAADEQAPATRAAARAIAAPSPIRIVPRRAGRIDVGEGGVAVAPTVTQARTAVPRGGTLARMRARPSMPKSRRTPSPRLASSPMRSAGTSLPTQSAPSGLRTMMTLSASAMVSDVLGSRSPCCRYCDNQSRSTAATRDAVDGPAGAAQGWAKWIDALCAVAARAVAAHDEVALGHGAAVVGALGIRVGARRRTDAVAHDRSVRAGQRQQLDVRQPGGGTAEIVRARDGVEAANARILADEVQRLVDAVGELGEVVGTTARAVAIVSARTAWSRAARRSPSL